MALLRMVLLLQQLLLLLTHAGLFTQASRAIPQSLGCLSVTTETANSQVRSICEEMTMDGCERCMPSFRAGKQLADCDLLDTYSYLCYQMPEMYQCAEWHAMCKANPILKLCYPSVGSGVSGCD